MDEITNKNLTDATIYALRAHAIHTEDCELSRICSAALWTTGRQRSNARAKIVVRLNRR